jgi:mannosylglycerate hydrolase
MKKKSTSSNEPKKGVEKFKEMHVVSNTHWDREFRMPFQRTRHLLVRMMDALLDQLESDPDFASYTMDSHTILMEDYLEIRPENRERIEKLVSANRLIVGPWYTLPDIPNIGQESVIRNLLMGHKVSRSLGGEAMKVGYTPCSWGQTGQLPQIYAGFDIHEILFYRGISPHESPAEFVWESPDGTRAIGHRFALFARYNYYYLVFRKITYGLDFEDRQWFWGDEGETPFRVAEEGMGNNIDLLEPKVLYKKENLKPAIEEMLRFEGKEYQYPYFLAMHGHDISWAHPKESEVIRDANKVQRKVKVLHSDLPAYFESLRKELDEKEMTVLHGERRCNLKEGFWTYLLPGTVSARTYLKKDNTRTEGLLAGQAEPLSIMSWMSGVEYPSVYLEEAWRQLMGNHTHDAHTGCANDAVTRDVEYRFRQSRDLSETLVQENLKELVCRIDTRGAKKEDHFLVVFNPSAFPRSEVAALTLDLPEEAGVQSFDLVDESGQAADYQLRSVQPEGLFVDNKWNVPQTYLCTRFRIFLDARDIPALGYKTYQVIPKQTPDRRSGSLKVSPVELENEFLRVMFEPNGSFSVEDKDNGAVYPMIGSVQDQGEVGNAWRHEAPREDQVINSEGASARITLLEDGPLSATMKTEFSIKVPAEAVGSEKRSENEVDIPVAHTVKLSRGSRRLDVTTTFDNKAKDHWLRLLVPTGLDTDFSSADSHFDVVDRPIALPDCDDWKEPVVGTFPMRSFVSLSDGDTGLAVLTEGLHEYEVFDDEHSTLAVSLVRSVRIKLEVAENRKQELADPGSQCPGRQEFRWGLYPFSGDWAKGHCPVESNRFLTPLRAAQFGCSARGRAPRQQSFLELRSEAVVLSAVKKAEDRDSLIVRLYNPTGKSAAGELVFGKDIVEVYRTNMNEERQGAIKKFEGNILPVKLGKKKIQTLEVVF